MRRIAEFPFSLLTITLLTGCPSGGGDIPTRDAGPRRDAGSARDGGALIDDAGPSGVDAGLADGGGVDMDAATGLPDAGVVDAGVVSMADATVADAGVVSMPDSGPVDGGRDGGRDGAVDAGAPSSPPVIDGIVGIDEWAAATQVSTAIVSAWSPNRLSVMRARLLPTGLYLAIEGFVESGTSANALVVYVDRARGSTEGVGSLASLTDTSGALDNAVTAPFVTPSDVRVDFAWGTNAMSRSASGSDERTGWRDLVRGTPGDLFWVPATDAPTVCSATACETYLPRTLLDAGLGAARPRSVALFARIVNSDGSMSPNQSLPEDASSTPFTVSTLMTLTE